MNKASFIVSKAQPGAWNDLDMLEVGNGAMSDDEYVAHFSTCKFKFPPYLLLASQSNSIMEIAMLRQVYVLIGDT